MSDKYFVGQDMTSFSDNGQYKPISRVTLLLDNEKSLTAGDDTGMEITASCPHATQEMVNALLQKMKGYQYQAYEAGAANIDPAAELGDGVNVGGLYSPLSRIADDGRGYADISSPGELEMEDEYPSGGYIKQEFDRKIAQTRSLITKTSEAIMLKVEGIDGKYTEVKTTLDGLTVTDASGTTKIKGSSIETSTLKVSAANITGALLVGQLPSGVAMDDDIPTKLSELTNDSGYQNASGVVSIVNGTVTADYIYALGVEASVIRGNSVGLKDGSGNTVGAMQLSYTSTGMGIGFSTNQGGIQMAPAGNVFLHSGLGAFITIADYITLGGGPLLLSDAYMFGSSPPSHAPYGALFFIT